MKNKFNNLKKAVYTEVKVRLSECDPYGIANNANYFIWFEMGRFTYAKESGYKITSMDATDSVIYITLSTKCNYLKPAHFDDTLLVKTKLAKLPILYAKFAFEQELIDKETHTVLAKCITENAAVSRDTHTVLRLNDDKALIAVKKDIDEE